MNKQSVFAIVLALASPLGYAEGLDRFEFVQKFELEQACNNMETLSCVNVDKDDCLKQYGECFVQLPDSISENLFESAADDFKNCMQKGLDIRTKDISNCSSEEGDSSNYDEKATSEDDKSRRKADLATKKESLTQGDSSYLSVAETEDSSLPIYKPSTANSKFEVKGGMNTLMLTSSDSIQDIDAFYKKKLIDFERIQISEGEILFIESTPKDFNINLHQQHYKKTPHVLLSIDSEDEKLTRLEMSYVPR